MERMMFAAMWVNYMLFGDGLNISCSGSKIVKGLERGATSLRFVIQDFRGYRDNVEKYVREMETQKRECELAEPEILIEDLGFLVNMLERLRNALEYQIMVLKVVLGQDVKDKVEPNDPRWENMDSKLKRFIHGLCSDEVLKVRNTFCLIPVFLGHNAYIQKDQFDIIEALMKETGFVSS